MRKSFLFQFQHMACALTQGYSQDCRDSVGGAKEIYFIEFPNVTAITVTSNVVTAITKTTAKRFWKYVPARDTLSTKETPTINIQNGTNYIRQEINLALNKMQTNTRNEIKLLSQNLLLAVVKDNNGKFWLYGQKNGIDVTGGEAGTGGAPGDRNGYSITLGGDEPDYAIEVDSATAGALETAGV